MKNLTFSQIIKALNALNYLVEQDKSKAYTFPSGARIRMGTNLRKLREIYTEIEKEQTDLFKAHGSEVPDKPGTFQVLKTSEKWPEFEKLYNDFQKETFEVDINPISEVELINARIVKSRDEKGQVSENATENQIAMDLIADLQSAELLGATHA